LGRFVGSSFANSHTLILWSDAGANLASCTITTSSAVDADGYAWETISNYTLAANTFYRVSSNETDGGDVWIDAGWSSSILTGPHTLVTDFDSAEFDAVHTGSQNTFPGNFHIADYAYGKMQMYESTGGGGGGGGGGSSKNNLLVGSVC
jgi:hypothetical protein